MNTRSLIFPWTQPALPLPVSQFSRMDHFADELAARIWDTDTEKLELLVQQPTNSSCSIVASLRTFPEETLALAAQKGGLQSSPPLQRLAQQAFEVLSERIWAYLIPCLFRWGVNPTEAEDLAQDILVGFWESRLAGYYPTISFRPYLRRIAHNRWVSLLRRPRTQELPSADVSDYSDQPVQNVTAAELKDRVQQGLNRLPPDLRFVLTQTMNGKNIAEVLALWLEHRELGLPPTRAQAYKLLYSARRELELYVEKYL